VRNLTVITTEFLWKAYTMDKLQLTGQTLGRVFNSRNDRTDTVYLFGYEAKLSNLK